MNGQIKADTLFLGLTRPPMLFGVSYAFTLLNFLLCIILYLIYVQFKFIFLIFPIHLVGYYLCSKEPLFIELIQIKVSKCMSVPNKSHYKSNCYDVF